MVKMEFLKRKHFSLWISAALLLGVVLNETTALQGVPTWMCLGMKSPFIEFTNEVELLANNSVPLNITKDEQALMHQEGLRKLGTFIKPVDLRDSSTGFVKANLTKKVYGGTVGIQMPRRMHPIQEEMDQKQIILLDEDTDENGLPASLTDEDRRFIVPMALKNASPDPRIPITTPKTTTTTRATTTTSKKTTTSVSPDFAANIDDLKNHILFLQNLTKHDSNFQSKFVVFPSLQKDKYKQTIGTTTVRPQRPIFHYSAPILPPTRKTATNKSPIGQPFGGYYHNEDDDSMSIFLSQAGNSDRDKITIVPQVLLLNDQTNGKKLDFDQFSSTSTTPLPTTTSTTPGTTTPRRPTKKPVCLRNPESQKCVRQRKREELQRQRDREQWLREQAEYLQPRFEPWVQTLNNTKRFAVSIEIPDSFKKMMNKSNDEQMQPFGEMVLPVLSRAVRSQPKRRNIGGGLQGRNGDKFATKYGTTHFEREAVLANGARDFLLANPDQYSLLQNGTSPSPTVAAYSEVVDLNPDNCYLVDGMTYGQKKQCVLHTSVMPAISRGARAAIQECQYQFKNRRWNCSTTEDNTVFGPMTGLGSPEMAFIHALAAATVTSFIARACRDGQLASCGCSRGSRPKQLHDDWTWGGCGDNLEYAYKFATDFIDIREKETRRGTRGAGNPERKRGRFHQRRNQQMQADDAGAVAATFKKINVTTTTMKSARNITAATTLKAPTNISTTTASTTIENINNDNNQQIFNKTVKNDANNMSNSGISSSSSSSSGSNDNSNSNSQLPTVVTASSKDTLLKSSSVAPPKQEESSEEDTN
ncbi:protein Wnt-5-like [Teleopsis dalmanni]|uniref:protein Wnt-5-like n=1 Tax=Teleopsis dalmanni TaxID=139649 RepID=UPI0018CEDCAC|nr:protein Wnt-5-like [Teleopsis dalmanni]